MASSNSTQKTDAQIVEERLKAKKIAAMVQTQNETTTIPPAQEPAFHDYIKKWGVKDLDHPKSHYDYRGAFMANVVPTLDPKDGKYHFPDRFKQHGHDTFSVESQYSKGPADGGHWVGTGPEARFVPAGQETGAVVPGSPGALDAFGPASFGADTSALDGFLQPTQVGDGALTAFGPPGVVTSVDPLTDTITQHPDFPIPLIPGSRGGEFTDMVYGLAASTAKMFKNAAIGGFNMTLGSASAPVPLVSEEEAKAARARGEIVETPAGIEQNRLAAAFVAAELGSAAAATTILRGITPFAKTVLKGTAAGAAFGAVRGRAPDETLLHAVYVDAIMFGGLSLVGGLVGHYTKPISVGIDELERANIKVHPEALKGREYGKAVFEEIQSVADDMQPETFAEGVPRTAETALDPANLPGVTRAHNPENISILRRGLGSPSYWGETSGIVGDASERVVTNFRNRAALARRLFAEWDATLSEAKNALFSGRFMLPATRQFESEELGKLLDTVFTGAELPAGLPPGYAKAFTLLRDRLLADREVFKLQRGGAPDYGIDAYLPHVWVGDLSLVDAETNAILRPGVKWDELRQTAAQVVSENPNVKVRAVPREWILPTDIAQFGIKADAIAPFIERAAKALTLEPDELAQIIAENKLIRVKTPGQRFFGHTEARSANLPGYVTDPFQALRLYAMGASRNMAFFNARPQAEAILSKLGEFRGTGPSINALRSYVDAVSGVPSPLETLVKEGVKQMARTVTKPFGPGVQLIAEDIGEGLQNTGRNALGLIAKGEALARLGWNPMAWMVQLTQTIVNTASAIGYGPTIRGLRLLYDKGQQAQVDALLRAGDIRLVIPLADADRILTRNIGVRTPWSPLYAFNRADTGNSAVAFLAKYQEQILSGADAGKALQEAMKFRTQTNFDYSIADAPRVLRGQVGSTLFQFKKFFVKEVEFFNHLSPAGKARFTANVWSLFGLSGLFTLPPLALLNWAVGATTGETIVERGQRLFPRASRGLPGFAGFDLGSAGSIGTPREVSDLFGPGVLDAWTLAHDVAMPWLIDTIRGKGGNLSPTDKARAIAELMPTMARRIADAYDIYSSGLVQVRGTHIPKFMPDDPSHEAFLTAFGIKSLQASEEQRVWNVTRRQSGIFEADRSALLQQVVKAYFDNQDRRMSELIQWGIQQDPPLIVHSEELMAAIARTAMPRTFREAVRGPELLRPERVQTLPPFLFPR